MVDQRVDEVGLADVGVVGVGHVGIHYVRHLIEAGARVPVYDTDSDNLSGAVKLGADAKSSCREVAQNADTILLAVPNPTAVRTVLQGEDGVFAGAANGTLIIDASTGDPETVRAMYHAAKAKGIDYIEAPISGGEPGGAGTDGASAGNITFMVGGDEDAFRRALPILETLGSHAMHLGPSGSGSIAKLLSNHIAGLVNLVVAESFTLGAAAGFGFETLLEVFARTDANTFMMSEYIAQRLRRRDYEAGFSVDLMYKDHRLAGDLARALKVPMFLNSHALESYQVLRARGLGHKDVTQMFPVLADAAGTTIDERKPIRTASTQ